MNELIAPTHGVTVGLVVKGDEWRPPPQLRELARARARTLLDGGLLRLGLLLVGELHERVEDDEWGGIMLTLSAKGRLG